MPDLAGLWTDLPKLLLAVGGVYALTWAPSLWAKRSAVLPVLTPSDKPSISEAYAALETLKRWGVGRGDSYTRGVTLIENNWLATAEGDGDAS